MGHAGKYRARIFRAPGQKQKTIFDGKLIGCTETSFAVGCGDTSNNALRVTESICRKLSGEWPPDPASPGLRQAQLVTIAGKLHIPYKNATGKTWEQLIVLSNENRRLVIQLWYSDVGGSNIGHAFLSEAIRSDEMLCMDPITGKRKWYKLSAIKKAMRTLAIKNGGTGTGLYFGYFQKCKYVASGAF